MVSKYAEEAATQARLPGMQGRTRRQNKCFAAASVEWVCVWVFCVLVLLVNQTHKTPHKKNKTTLGLWVSHNSTIVGGFHTTQQLLVGFTQLNNCWC